MLRRCDPGPTSVPGNLVLSPVIGGSGLAMSVIFAKERSIFYSLRGFRLDQGYLAPTFLPPLNPWMLVRSSQGALVPRDIYERTRSSKLGWTLVNPLPSLGKRHTLIQSVTVALTKGNSPVGPGAKLSFELTGEQGAVLVTNHPTYREDIERRGKFEAYIKKHYDSWKEFSQVVGHGRESPVLVTGVDLTKKFAAIAYYKNPTSVECDFSVEAPDVASASASAWGSWRTLGLVHTTCGPDEYIRRTQRTRHANDGNSSESLIPEGNDQCVLIRYYTIRKFLGFKHLKAAAGPHRLPEGDAGDGGAGIHCPGGSLSVTHNVPPVSSKYQTPREIVQG